MPYFPDYKLSVSQCAPSRGVGSVEWRHSPGHPMRSVTKKAGAVASPRYPEPCLRPESAD